MSLEEMMGALLEDEEVPITLRFGTTRIEATPPDFAMSWQKGFGTDPGSPNR